MTYKTRILSCILSTMLLLSAPGCSDNDKKPAKTESTTEVTSAESAKNPDQSTNELTEEEIEKIKDIYKLSEEEAEAFANEKTSSPIIYAGFRSHYFSTPAKSDNIPVTSVTSILSRSGMHDYIAENSANYSLDEGADSFSSVAEKYDDKFFDTKGLLIISFTDTDGGSDYNISGAWSTTDKAGDITLDRLVFSTKRSAGDITTGHFIIEVDVKFMMLWDAFGIEIYE